MITRIRQIAGLSFTEWVFLSVATLLLPCMGLCLRFFGYRRTQSFLKNRVIINRNREPASLLAIDRAQTIARMVGIAARHGPYHANCLGQALVLHWVLTMVRIPAEIKFGIPHQFPDQGSVQFTAHAWVEYLGINLSDIGSGRHYAVFTG
jgi:hypothetical protein